MSDSDEDSQRPSRISINPWKEKFSQNKSEYFTFQSDTNSCFKKDCERFFLAFEQHQSFSFRTFSEVWKNMSFSLIFAGQEFVDELEWFMESAFFTIKKYLIFSESIYVQVCAFYMLYGLYFKQLCSEKVQIRQTSDEYEVILSLLQKMEEREVTHFVGIFTLLKCQHAFWFVAKPRQYGLEGKFMWREKKLKDDIFQSTKKTDPVLEVEKTLNSTDFYGLNYLVQVDQEYMQLLNQYGISTSSENRTASLVKDLKSIPYLMKGVPGENNKNTKGTEDTVQDKRAKIRNKAFEGLSGVVLAHNLSKACTRFFTAPSS